MAQVHSGRIGRGFAYTYAFLARFTQCTQSTSFKSETSKEHACEIDPDSYIWKRSKAAHGTCDGAPHQPRRHVGGEWRAAGSQEQEKEVGVVTIPVPC